MNWRRGLWRLWLVAGLVWIGFWVWFYDLPCMLGLPNPLTYGGWCSYFGPDDRLNIERALALIFAPPLAAPVLALAGLWIYSGFVPRARKSN